MYVNYSADNQTWNKRAKLKFFQIKKKHWNKLLVIHLLKEVLQAEENWHQLETQIYWKESIELKVVSVCMLVYILIYFIFLMYKTQLYFGVCLTYMCNIYDDNNRGFDCAITCGR